MAQYNYYERPTKKEHRKIWDRLAKDKEIDRLDFDYNGMCLVTYYDGETHYVDDPSTERNL